MATCREASPCTASPRRWATTLGMLSGRQVVLGHGTARTAPTPRRSASPPTQPQRPTSTSPALRGGQCGSYSTTLPDHSSHGGLNCRPDGPAAIPAWGGNRYEQVTEEQTEILARSAWTESSEEGLRFWGQLFGPALSSTRVEAWAIVGAHLIPRPLHLGIDKKRRPGHAQQYH